MSYLSSSFSFKKIIIINLLLLLLVGCTSTSTVNKPSPKYTAYSIENKGLRKYYNNWAGTPYRLGGTTKSGIDCSAFTQRVYKDEFNVKLPRATNKQVTRGKKITKGKRKVGDLVFFKTGRNQRHVGVYVGNNLFMHASTSKGVMISNLGDGYWKKHYWQTRRVLN